METRTSMEPNESPSRDFTQKRTCISSHFRRIDGPWSWFMCVLFLFSVLFQYGCTTTYGILFPDILRGLRSSRALTAIPGSAAVANTGLLGIFIGKLCDHFGCRKVVFMGSIIGALGLTASSFATNIGVLIGTFGFLLGTGSCMVYFGTILAVPTYFQRYRFQSYSLVSIGPGSSLLVMTPLVQSLNSSLGWRRCMLVMSSFSAIPFLVSLVMRSKNRDSEHVEMAQEECQDNQRENCKFVRGLFYFSALKIKVFLLTTVIFTISGLGHSMPFVHLAKISEELGIESNRSSWLYLIIGLGSTVSRLLVGKFGKSGLLSLPSISLLGNALLALGNFILPSTSVYYALVLYSVAFGLGEGMLVTPLKITVLDCLPSGQRGRGFGVFEFIISVAYSIGPILSGFIADVSGSYKSAFYTAGVLEAIGGCMCLLFQFIPVSKLDLENIYTIDTSADRLIIVERETVL